MNERRLVEDLVLVAMLLNVVKRGVSDLSDPTAMTTLRHLQAAAREVLAQAPLIAHEKIMRRVHSVGRRCVNSHLPLGARIAILGLAAYYLLEHLIDAGYIVIGGSSPFQQALDAILPSLEMTTDDSDLLRGRAMAVVIFADLQKEGLFRGLDALA